MRRIYTLLQQEDCLTVFLEHQGSITPLEFFFDRIRVVRYFQIIVVSLAVISSRKLVIGSVCYRSRLRKSVRDEVLRTC